MSAIVINGSGQVIKDDRGKVVETGFSQPIAAYPKPQAWYEHMIAYLIYQLDDRATLNSYVPIYFFLPNNCGLVAQISDVINRDKRFLNWRSRHNIYVWSLNEDGNFQLIQPSFHAADFLGG